MDTDEEARPLVAKIKLLKSKCPGKQFWCKSCIFSGFCAVVVASIVSPVIFVVNKDSADQAAIDNRQSYHPGDTQLYTNFSTFYCQGLDMTAEAGASLYLVPETPPLSVSNDVVKYSTSVNDINSWQYLLHKNSTITVQACTKSDQVQTASIYIIKGFANYSSYQGSIDIDIDPVSYIAQATVRNVCSISNTTLKFTVQETDTYFISISNKGDTTVNGIIGWSIVRTEYSVSNFSQPLTNCASYSGDTPCTLFVPLLSSDRVLLVKLGVTNPTDYNTYLVTINCNPRPAAYVILALSAFILTMCAGLIFCCVCDRYCCKKKKLNQRTPLLGNTPRNYRPYHPDNGRYPHPDPVTNNYPRPDPAPAPVNNYPPPQLQPTPVNNYRHPPQPVPTNNYPPPQLQPTPVNNYHPAAGNNYPPPDPNLPPPQYLPSYPKHNSTKYPMPDPIYMDKFPPPSY